MAGDAEAALGSLTWTGGLQAITQHGLQALLWHELPRKWLTDRRQAAHGRFTGAVAGAGRATPLGGDLPWAPDRRGAAGLRGRRPGGLPGVPPGAEALRGGAAGHLPGPRLWFAWGPVMGGESLVPSARWRRRWSLRSPAASCAPGARSWRAAQQAVTRRHLAAAEPELDGRSWLEVVAAAERRSEWARSRGEARRALVDPVLPRLAGRPLPPVPVPTGAAHGPCDRRWRWRARLGERTGTPPADLWARVLAGARGRQLEPLEPVVLHRRRPRLRR